MFLAAGELYAAVAGESWDDCVAKRFFAPLRMARSTTSVDPLPGIDNVATPHEEVEGKVVPVPWYDLDNVAPAGSINSSAREMAAWVRLQLGRRPDQILTEPTDGRDAHAADGGAQGRELGELLPGVDAHHLRARLVRRRLPRRDRGRARRVDRRHARAGVDDPGEEDRPGRAHQSRRPEPARGGALSRLRHPAGPAAQGLERRDAGGEREGARRRAQGAREGEGGARRPAPSRRSRSRLTPASTSIPPTATRRSRWRTGRWCYGAAKESPISSTGTTTLSRRGSAIRGWERCWSPSTSTRRVGPASW